MRSFMVSVLLVALAGPALAAPTLWIGASSGDLITVDVATGSHTLIGNSGFAFTDIAFSPSGELYGITFSNLYKIDTTTAAATFIATYGGGYGNAAVFNGSGTLFTGLISLQSVDPTNGAVTPIGSMSPYSSAGDLAFNGGNLYLASSSNNLVQINPLTGAPTLIGNMGVSSVYGMATAGDGVLYAVALNSIYSVNTTTGAATFVSSFSSAYIAFGTAFLEETQGGGTPTSIPVPGLAIALAAAAASLRFSRR